MELLSLTPLVPTIAIFSAALSLVPVSASACHVQAVVVDVLIPIRGFQMMTMSVYVRLVRLCDRKCD